MPYRYHASDWPLMLAPAPGELLRYLHADYGRSDESTDDYVCAALRSAGHDTTTDLARRVLSAHSARRYEALTGNPF